MRDLIVRMDTLCVASQESAPCSDHALLLTAKRQELQGAGVPDPSVAAVVHKAVSREELARHCRRRTRGAEIHLSRFSSQATDSPGVLEEMTDIWYGRSRSIMWTASKTLKIYNNRAPNKGGCSISVLNITWIFPSAQFIRPLPTL